MAEPTHAVVQINCKSNQIKPALIEGRPHRGPLLGRVGQDQPTAQPSAKGVGRGGSRTAGPAGPGSHPTHPLRPSTAQKPHAGAHHCRSPPPPCACLLGRRSIVAVNVSLRGRSDPMLEVRGAWGRCMPPRLLQPCGGTAAHGASSQPPISLPSSPSPIWRIGCLFPSASHQAPSGQVPT
jgi:hypothetical protein